MYLESISLGEAVYRSVLNLTEIQQTYMMQQLIHTYTDLCRVSTYESIQRPVLQLKIPIS